MTVPDLLVGCIHVTSKGDVLPLVVTCMNGMLREEAALRSCNLHEAVRHRLLADHVQLNPNPP